MWVAAFDAGGLRIDAGTATVPFYFQEFIMFKQYEVKFRYADSYSHWEWHNQQCSVYARDQYEARLKCMELYGLGTDCDYEILSVTEI